MSFELISASINIIAVKSLSLFMNGPVMVFLEQPLVSLIMFMRKKLGLGTGAMTPMCDTVGSAER
ncbi:MAG: hypothetical protein GY786_25490 [Proteobacteria bacterium]|nr:hypothetical protein [Pseudomonadota bacterium]